MWQVMGQGHVARPLQRALEEGRLHHAYLLVGPPHVGKMTLALNLAQAVNCTGDGPPCGGCAPCRRIAAGRHADVQVIGLDAGEGEQGRAEIGIDTIRELRRAASLRPYEGRYRVFIIDEAERLSPEAANSLLKTLEEPPPEVLLLLLVTDDEELPATIISRCQRLDLRPLPQSQAAELLTEQHGVGEEQAQELARLSQGCLGWAIRAAQDEAVLRERNGYLERIIQVPQATLQERFAYAAELARRFQRHRRRGRQELYLWLRWWRDVLLTKVGLEAWVAHRSRREQLTEQAKGCSLAQIVDVARAVGQTLEALDRNVNPRLALELLMLTVPMRAGVAQR